MKHTEEQARAAIERIANRVQDSNRKQGKEVNRQAARDLAREVIIRHERKHSLDR